MTEIKSNFKEIKFNDESVVYSIQSPLLLSASAGSGKTSVLVERYLAIFIYLIVYRKNSFYDAFQSIVALTFTRKAADEMKDRIRNKIEASFDEIYLSDLFNKLELFGSGKIDNKRDSIEYLKANKENILNALSHASITTIHSFGLSIILKYPIETGIDPYSSPLDESGIEELSTTSQDAYTETIRYFIDTKDHDFAQIVEIIGYNAVSDWLNEIHKAVKSKGIEEVVGLLKRSGYFDYDNDKNIEESVIKETIPALTQIKSELYLLSESEKRSKIKVDAVIKKIEDFLLHRKNMDIFSADLSYEGTSTIIHNVIDPLYENLYFILNKILLPYLWRCYLLFHKKYEILKDFRKEITFSDIELILLKLLKFNLEIRKNIQNKIKYILIDEYQDTSDIQKEIFDLMVYNENNSMAMTAFMVGDPKQSIYGFRSANVEIFYATKQKFQNMSEIYYKEINLNYRSSERMVKAFNEVFTDIFSEGNIIYQYQNSNKNETGSSGNGLFFIPAEGDNTSSIMESSSKYAADLICRLIRNGYQPSDILVLFRKKNKYHNPQ